MSDAAKVDSKIRGISVVNLGHLATAVVTIAILAAPFFNLFYIKAFGNNPTCDADLAECRDAEGFRVFIAAIWLAIFSLAATSGCLGIILSFFLRQTKGDAINVGTEGQIKNPIFIGAREIFILMFFGTVFGILITSLFIGGLIQGSLFPSFSGIHWVNIRLQGSDWAKIFIWSLLAGFSERLIPSLLDNLVRHIDVKPGQGGYVPKPGDSSKDGIDVGQKENKI